jgi:hypothetical protein
MRFMVLGIPGDKKVETGALPDEKIIAAMMKYNEELAKAGVLLALDGLHPSSMGARIRERELLLDRAAACARELAPPRPT